MNALNNLDGKMTAVRGISLRSNPNYDLKYFENFKQWTKYALEVTDPDEARHALYYVFQPLYDIVLTRKMLPTRRKKAVMVLNDVIETGKKYLAGYYLGEPEVKLINDLSKRIGKFVSAFKPEHYYYKKRNVDTNDVYPSGIGKFIYCYLEKISSDGKAKPDVVVGCACGASEIAMALAGILEADLVFARRSKRRDDDKAKIVKEHEKVLPRLIKNKRVTVIEDYVCSGGSLYDVIKKVDEFRPQAVTGASVMSCYGGEYNEEGLVRDDTMSKFNTFKYNK